MSVFFNSNGFLSFMYLGPAYKQKYRYVPRMVNSGPGVPDSSHGFVRWSVSFIYSVVWGVNARKKKRKTNKRKYMKIDLNSTNYKYHQEICKLTDFAILHRVTLNRVCSESLDITQKQIQIPLINRMNCSTKSTAEFGCSRNHLFLRIGNIYFFLRLCLINGFYVCVTKSPHAFLDITWTSFNVEKEMKQKKICMHVCMFLALWNFKRKRVKGFWTFLNVTHLCCDAVILH